MSLLNLSVIIVTVAISACAQLLFKLGMAKVADGQFLSGIESLVKTLFSPLIFAGLSLYAISVIAWLWVLSRVELSVAYPFVGLSFIATLVLGYAVLDESVNTMRVVGTFCIAIGCVFVARS